MRTGLLRIKSWYRYIPTSLTLGNSLCGFTAILCTLEAHVPEPGKEVPQLLAVSAWLIVGAMIFDMLDGWTARMLKVFSDHGIQMDSLADMVTFGVAPAVMVAVMAHTNQLTWLPTRWVWLMCALYLGCVALRLALYNVTATAATEAEGFRGLPSPGGAAAVSSLVILYSDPLYQEYFLIITELLPYYAGILGVLMVSSIPYMHIGHWLGSKRKNKLKILLLIIFFLAFSWKSRLVAALAINIYVLSGPLTVLIVWILRHTVPQHASPAVREKPST